MSFKMLLKPENIFPCCRYWNTSYFSFLVWFIYCFGAHRRSTLGWKATQVQAVKTPLNVYFNISKLQIRFQLPGNKTEMRIMKKIFYFWEVANSLLCWLLILSRESNATVTGYKLFFLYVFCLYVGITVKTTIHIHAQCKYKPCTNGGTKLSSNLKQNILVKLKLEK